MRAPSYIFVLALAYTANLARGFQTTPLCHHSLRTTYSQLPVLVSLNTIGGTILLPTAQGTSLAAETATSESSAWTKKRLHNTAAFRSIAILAVLAVTGFSSQSQRLIPSQAMAIVHTLSFATWFGTVAYTTFVAGITMFKNLPRQTFGKLQSKLFPKYFSISSFALVLQLATLQRLSALKAVTVQNSTRALAISLVMTLLNQFYLEPQSTNNMMERYDLEDAGQEGSDRYKTLKASFGKFHGMSSLANLIALCGGVAHAVYLASSLVL